MDANWKIDPEKLVGLFPRGHPQGLGAHLVLLGSIEVLNLSQLWELAASSPPGAGWALRPKCQTAVQKLFLSFCSTTWKWHSQVLQAAVDTSELPSHSICLWPCLSQSHGPVVPWHLGVYWKWLWFTRIFTCRYRHTAECVARWDGSAYALLALFLVLWKPIVFFISLSSLTI